MSIINEVERYCNIEKPMGALLLTGQWGCGKTHFIKHTLRDRLSKTHEIIRVSLFGVSSVDEIQKAVKAAWIHSGDNIVLSKIADGLDSLKPYSDMMEKSISNRVIKGFAGVLSIDLLEFVQIKNKHGEKKVILVFDDFERSDVSVKERIGVVNEYCENQEFCTIIVAEEGKLDADDDYKEMKEKVIYKTVHFDTDYLAVVGEIVNQHIPGDEYRGFLQGNREGISAILGTKDKRECLLMNDSESYGENYASAKDEENKKLTEYMLNRPCNLRSLIGALEDFRVIYCALRRLEVMDINKWLFSFVSFRQAVDRGFVQKRGTGGYAMVKRDMCLLYPGLFEAIYIPDSIIEWVMGGAWDEQDFSEYVNRYHSRNTVEPRELVKIERVDLLEEEIAKRGMEDVISEVYDGKLTMDEYVLFIINTMLVRKYGLMDYKISWGKVKEGIKKRIEYNIINRDISHSSARKAISDFSEFTEEEKDAYQLIKTENDENYSILESNRRNYIELMKNRPEEAFSLIQGMVFDSFDIDMAMATVDGFKRIKNDKKALFPMRFKGVWVQQIYYYSRERKRVNNSKQGLIRLKEELQLLAKEYEGSPFKLRYTIDFSDSLERLMQEYLEPEK